MKTWNMTVTDIQSSGKCEQFILTRKEFLESIETQVCYFSVML